MKIELPFWMNKSHSIAFINFLNSWFTWLKNIISFPVQQFDSETAVLALVDLIAWERNIERFNNEPEWLYRKRVKYAYQNSKDAGSNEGFIKIWNRFELGYIEIEERIEGRDWDVIGINISDNVISKTPELLDILIESYGRTCRRYEWTVMTTLKTNVRAAGFEHITENSMARL